MRKEPLVTGEVYHVFTKSIAGYRIFNNDVEFSRMLNVICYYQRQKLELKFSDFIRSANVKTKHFPLRKWESGDEEKLVEIIAYCLMPTHIHLILKQLKENGISTFMRKILDSYTRYFNTKHKRKGPLWEGKFQNVLVKTDEQLLHLTRYIHLNPVTAYLVDKPEDWPMSSYQEYLSNISNSRISKYDGILDIEPKDYQKFVADRIGYQRELTKIEDLFLEDPFPTSEVGNG